VTDDLVTIRLEGMTGFAHHGVEDEERRLGQRFVADVELDLVSSAATTSDALEDTVDYAALAATVREELEGEPVDLLERLAARIADHILLDGRVTRVSVTIAKPDLRLDLGARASVTVRRSR